MQQKELASLLDISPAMVSRLAKRGMPTDTLERAERWRKRHLEPGRVKGSRMGTINAAARNPGSPPSTAHHLSDDAVAAAATSLDAETTVVEITLADMEATGQLADLALALPNPYAAAVRIFQLRNQLRIVNANLDPRFSARVWLALTDYVLHEESEFRNTPNMDELLTPGEFGKRLCPEHPWTAGVALWEACDFDDNALDGWPDGVEDDD